jgi:hypothetical protein
LFTASPQEENAKTRRREGTRREKERSVGIDYPLHAILEDGDVEVDEEAEL